jgi:hypothetical protein
VRVALDDGASLIPVEARHQDVAKDQVGFVVIDLGQGVEAVFREEDFVAALFEEDLGASPNGVAVVNDKHFVARSIRAHFAAPL